MSGPEFFQTPMGRQFYESTVPRIATAMERLTAALAALPSNAFIPGASAARDVVGDVGDVVGIGVTGRRAPVADYTPRERRLIEERDKAQAHADLAEERLARFMPSERRGNTVTLGEQQAVERLRAVLSGTGFAEKLDVGTLDADTYALLVRVVRAAWGG